MKLFLIIGLFAFLSVNCQARHLRLEEELEILAELADRGIELEEGDCKCRLNTDARIVGGHLAKKNQIPWQVSIATAEKLKHFCGGSIISKEYILTAAHCIKDLEAEDVKVRVGLHMLEDADLETNTYDVERIISGPFTNYKTPGDIAVLKLSEQIEFETGKVEPACLNLNERSYEGDLMASGWGLTSRPVKNASTGKVTHGDRSPVLKMAYFVEDEDMCEGRNAYTICIDSKKDNDSICQGDSGGPIHYSTGQNGRTTVEGVASFGKPKKSAGAEELIYCNGKAYYSRLSYYKDWLENIIGSNYCSL